MNIHIFNTIGMWIDIFLIIAMTIFTIIFAGCVLAFDYLVLFADAVEYIRAHGFRRWRKRKVRYWSFE
jgi:hypothetical protein